MKENSSTLNLRSWRGLYKAALFETDMSKLPSRIEEARRALVLRSRELFANSPNYDDETESVDNALYALQALENLFEIEHEGSQTRSPSRVDLKPLGSILRASKTGMVRIMRTGIQEIG